MTTSDKPLRTSLLALAAAATILVAGPVRAGLWSSDYDPPAFIGTALFDVPGPCLSTATDGSHTQSQFVGCAPIRIISNVATSPAIDFNPILPLVLCGSCQYEVIAGQFVGVNTGILGFVTVGGTQYWFQFVSTFIPGDGEFTPPSVTNIVNLYSGCTTTIEGPSCGDPVAVGTRVLFRAVPEPGPLVLILGALGAAWLARRRSRTPDPAL